MLDASRKEAADPPYPTLIIDVSRRRIMVDH
jgi:hypothetical protein